MQEGESVSGQRINRHQVQQYMKSREAGSLQETAAVKAGISVRSGRRIETHDHQRGRLHNWRTRADPLAQVWEQDLVPMLVRNPELQGVTLLEYLQQKYPGQFGQSVLRTLQRRIQQWRGTSGPPQEVMFPQRHSPGEMGLSDFTHFKQASITIAGDPFDHLLYHYRLAYSGWQYVQVIVGGESFVGLAEGLQNALNACGGAPQEHRSDSLSAAYRNRDGRSSEDLTAGYEQLCRHYQMRPSRNNRGVAHENGAIESAHGHFKTRLHQALLLRGSTEFESAIDYQEFIAHVVESLNQRCHDRFKEECQHLQALPAHRYPDYELLSVKVTTHSTITVRCVTYTVPSRLIGQTLTVQLHHNRLVGRLGSQTVVTLTRLRTPKGQQSRRLRSVNYRHVIDSLRRKPRAFLSCLWQQDLLPDDNYRQLWEQLCHQFDRDTAARLMTESLYIAATQDKEQAVATYLTEQLAQKTLSLSQLQQQFHWSSAPVIPNVSTQQHPLHTYDDLLCSTLRDPEPAAEIPETALHPPTVAGDGTSSPATGVDACPVFAVSVRNRSHSALPSPSQPLSQRRSPTAGKGFLKL
jgi:hypothetical protein